MAQIHGFILVTDDELERPQNVHLSTHHFGKCLWEMSSMCRDKHLPLNHGYSSVHHSLSLCFAWSYSSLSSDAHACIDPLAASLALLIFTGLAQCL